MPRLDFPWDVERGVGHRDDKAAPHFPMGSVYSLEVCRRLTSQMPRRLAPRFGCVFVSCQALFLPNWAQMAENKLSQGYPHPVGYHLSLKPKLLLSLDLHVYCSILREALNPHQNSGGGRSTSHCLSLWHLLGSHTDVMNPLYRICPWWLLGRPRLLCYCPGQQARQIQHFHVREEKNRTSLRRSETSPSPGGGRKDHLLIKPCPGSQDSASFSSFSLAPWTAFRF